MNASGLYARSGSERSARVQRALLRIADVLASEGLCLQADPNWGQALIVIGDAGPGTGEALADAVDDTREPPLDDGEPSVYGYD